MRRRDAVFSHNHEDLLIRKSKTMQFQERSLIVPLTHVPGCYLSPAQAVMVVFLKLGRGIRYPNMIIEAVPEFCAMNIFWEACVRLYLRQDSSLIILRATVFAGAGLVLCFFVICRLSSSREIGEVLLI